VERRRGGFLTNKEEKERESPDFFIFQTFKKGVCQKTNTFSFFFQSKEKKKTSANFSFKKKSLLKKQRNKQGLVANKRRAGKTKRKKIYFYAVSSTLKIR
jgi:hypothetical protein